MLWNIEQFAGTDYGVFDSSRAVHISYDALLDSVTALERVLQSDQKLLVALFCDNSLWSIVGYLAALRSGHAVVLLSAASDFLLNKRIIELYTPEIIVSSRGFDQLFDGYRAFDNSTENTLVAYAEKPSLHAIYPETAVLLSTSGTTGSPKLVRLSYNNIERNARSIVDYLAITPSETAITVLPISYSFGLSVLNSHLLVGASVVCTNASIMTRDFWTLIVERNCTSISGVPYTYEMLERLRFGKMELPSLQTLTQAGGRMPVDRIGAFLDICKHKGYRMFVMYGQTEATARISYVPYERSSEKIGSVGIAIPGGALGIEREGQRVNGSCVNGEIVYDGPNVMLGYAHSRKCLTNGDELRGTLYTGDIGYIDDDGYLYVTGRLKRFVKLFGLRVNLDDVERMLESAVSFPVACVGCDGRLLIIAECSDSTEIHRIKKYVETMYKIHHSAVEIHRTTQMPFTASGKKDYVTLDRFLD